MRIVTAGEKFTDIDAYAACIAYAELLRLQGVEAEIVLPGPLNGSVPEFLRTDNRSYQTAHRPSAGDVFIVLDVSDPPNIATFVRADKIERIVDHHPGFEDYWHQAGVTTQIEDVGAVCTQVFEYWQEAGLSARMNPDTAKLLIAGILDNTLNFTAKITKQRDHQAYKALLGIAGVGDDWREVYFGACQDYVERNVEASLEDDSKTMELAGLDEAVRIGQLVVWDGQSVLSQLIGIRDNSRATGPWFINLVSIKDGHNRIIFKDEQTGRFLENLLGAVRQEANMLMTNRLWLRKEIAQAAIDKYRTPSRSIPVII